MSAHLHPDKPRDPGDNTLINEINLSALITSPDMKLHLPKMLLTAMLSTIAMSHTARSANWDGKVSKNYYIGNGETVKEVDTSDSSSDDSDFHILAGANNITATIGSIISKDTTSLIIGNSSAYSDWGADDERAFKLLTVDDLQFGDGTGSGSVKVEAYDIGETNYSNTVVINQVSGTLSSVINDGTLTLGSAVTVSGDITNDGTLTLGGTVTGVGDGIQISGGSVNVQINNDSILHYEGVFTFVSADDSVLTGKKHGFLSGEQKLTILNNVTMGGDTAVNISGYTGGAYSGGVYTVDIKSEKTAFHVGDTWTYDSAVSKGATSFHVGPQGVLEFASPTSTMPVPISNFGQVVINAANGGVLDTLAKDITNINGSSPKIVEFEFSYHHVTTFY